MNILIGINQLDQSQIPKAHNATGCGLQNDQVLKLLHRAARIGIPQQQAGLGQLGFAQRELEAATADCRGDVTAGQAKSAHGGFVKGDFQLAFRSAGHCRAGDTWQGKDAIRQLVGILDQPLFSGNTADGQQGHKIGAIGNFNRRRFRCIREILDPGHGRKNVIEELGDVTAFFQFDGGAGAALDRQAAEIGQTIDAGQRVL